MNSARPLTAVLVACLAGALHAATLERLSLDDMTSKSTDIVRGRVVGSSEGFRGTPGRGGIIYTYYTIEIAERWKGGSGSRMDIAVPGGAVGALRQTFAGAPALLANTDYVFFLGSSRSGLTQIIGLTQGLMNLKLDSSGKANVSRPASAEPMVDAYGRPVTDTGFSMSMSEFRAAMGSFGLKGTVQ